MLHLQAELPLVAEDVANTKVVTEFESRRKPSAVVVVEVAEIMGPYAGFGVESEFIVRLIAKYRRDADVVDVPGIAANVAVLIFTDLRAGQVPVSPQMVTP